VLYDLFTDVATQLSAVYVERSRAAATEDGRAVWWAKVMALRDVRHAVPVDDRDALVRHIVRWRRELHTVDLGGG